MKILAIETSCDDTGIAILETSKQGYFKILANIISSQKIHQQYGGVFPAMAKREHQKNITQVMQTALIKAKLLKMKKGVVDEDQLAAILEREPELQKRLISFLQKHQKPDIDLISVVNGPGLEPCLWVGVNFARALSFAWNIPLVPVNHIESHILVNFLDLPARSGNKNIKFPAVALVVSGGHTQLILMKKVGSYKVIGETRDDAAGECFDKCAKLLGLGYPGGPIIADVAKKYKKKESIVALPRPMMHTKDYDFSFSGLKTAVLYADQKVKKNKKDTLYQSAMAREVQDAIVDVLVKKTVKAVGDFKAKTLILGGGVSANEHLRKKMGEALDKKVDYLIPEPHLSTDNALMSAITGYFHRNKKASWKNLKANANLRIDK